MANWLGGRVVVVVVVAGSGGGGKSTRRAVRCEHSCTARKRKVLLYLGQAGIRKKGKKEETEQTS